MCGINGFNWKDEILISRMNSIIKHRGPDDSGSYSDKNMTLGHVRLSIVDLSKAGHNPVFYSKKNGACSDQHNKNLLKESNIGITFNGEIYNYLDLKKELKQKGYVFTTKTDTEVILASYIEWGTTCVNKFNGMWAFCIYNKKENILFCSRDRLGVKPFYYYHKDKEFVFSSELKGILAAKKLNTKENISKEAVELYFSLGFIPSPLTIYSNCFKLEAGHNLIFDLTSKKLKTLQYYELPKYSPENNKKKLIQEGRRILYDATKLRMIADVPVGAFLSGGLDSSAVVGAMSKNTSLKNLHTFSIGFEGKYDESKYINLVKDYFKTKHHHYYFKEKDFEELIEQYSEIYDEPFADYSGFPTYKVSELAKKNVTVCLSGDGGDEIFGGYNSHKMGAQMELLLKSPKFIRTMISKIPAKKNLNKLASLFLLKEAAKLSLKDKNQFYSEALKEDKPYSKAFKKWTETKLKHSLNKGNNNLAESLRIYDLLFNTLSDNFLVKVDRASMQKALEVRSPFLDYRFIEFSQKIPTKWKTNTTQTKILMREIIKGIVPEEILTRGKQGFEPPIDKWILNKKHLFHLNTKQVQTISKEIQFKYDSKILQSNQKQNNIYKIRLFLFNKWCEKWLTQ